MYTVHCTVELIVIVYFFGTEGHGVRPFMDHISFLPQPYGLQYMYICHYRVKGYYQIEGNNINQVVLFDHLKWNLQKVWLSEDDYCKNVQCTRIYS